jgi:hypothetical protein
MPFQANQLYKIQFRKSATKWVSWKELVAERKQRHDKNRGVYPLEYLLIDANDHLLVRQFFDYVHAHSKMEVVVRGEWDAPLIFTEHCGADKLPFGEFFVEDIRVLESSGRQMLVTEVLEENEKG